MKVCSRLILAALCVGLAGIGTGCGDMGSLAYFLAPGQRLGAKMKHLASKDKKQKPPRVMILTYAGLETRAEFIHADRQLSELLASNLRKLAEPRQELLDVVPPRKVEEYKNAHPEWHTMKVDEVGRQFGADYVIYLELRSLSLYEPGNSNTLYRGRASLLVSLVEVNRPDETNTQNYVCTFPSEARGPVDVYDIQPIQFRQSFLHHIARELSWYFSKYPREQQRAIEQAQLRP